MVHWLAIAWVPATLFVLGFLVLLVACWRQGRRLVAKRRIVAVAAGLAALAAVPAVPTAVLGFCLARGTVEITWIDEGGTVHTRPYTEPKGPPELLAVFGVWLLLLRIARDCLRLPARFGHLHELLPPPPVLQERIASLAAKVGVRTPQLVYVPGFDVAMAVQGMTSGVLVPALVITDGVCHRLDEAQRDAVLAHEGFLKVGRQATGALSFLDREGRGLRAPLVAREVVSGGLPRKG